MKVITRLQGEKLYLGSIGKYQAMVQLLQFPKLWHVLRSCHLKDTMLKCCINFKAIVKLGGLRALVDL